MARNGTRVEPVRGKPQKTPMARKEEVPNGLKRFNANEEYHHA